MNTRNNFTIFSLKFFLWNQPLLKIVDNILNLYLYLKKQNILIDWELSKGVSTSFERFRFYF